MVAFFVVYLAFLFIQFGYVIIRRNSQLLRRTSPADLPISTTTVAGSVSHTIQIKNFLRRALKISKTSILTPNPAAGKQASTVVSSAPAVSVIVEATHQPGPTEEDVEDMLTGRRLMGPPRFLFTIKEEEREGSAADTASFEGSSESVVLSKETDDGLTTASDSAPHKESFGEEEEVTSPVIGLVAEVNQTTASSCSTEDKKNSPTGGVALTRIVLVP
ncbi:hypothetical protein LINGRAHAP2_LOCUS4986 [Linum grandiflorum]